MQVKFDNNNNIIFSIQENEIINTHSESLFESIQNGDKQKMSTLIYSLLGSFVELTHSSMENFKDPAVAIAQDREGTYNITVISNSDRFFSGETYKLINMDFKAISEILNAIKGNKRASTMFKNMADAYEAKEINNYKFLYEASADSLDQFIAFAKTMNLDDAETNTSVYKDERSRKYIIKVASTGKLLPGNYYEYLNVRRAHVTSFGSEEHLIKITTLGNLARL